MKKEIFNILFLSVVVLAVAWLYWPQKELNENQTKQGAKGHQNYVLAMSWQSAFCESKPNKPECRSQRKERYDAQNFSLHGLWPQPRNNIYCGISKRIVETYKRGRWGDLPKLNLSSKLRNELSKFMPGYRSNLHRHEWYKHGTCMGENATPEQYYAVSISSMDAINKSELQDIFAQNIGKEINSDQIVRAFERSFGKEARNRIQISCKRDGKRTLISEIKISISFDAETANLNTLAANLNNAPKLSIGCKRGIVDAVGLQ